MKHLFVINPWSLGSEAERNIVEDEITACFAGGGGDGAGGTYSIYVSRFPRDTVGYVRRYMKASDPAETVRVYAIGGDGILFDCLNGVVGFPNGQLAPVPYGKTNDFVRAFGEGMNGRFRNIADLVNGEIIPTDVMYYGNNYSVNIASVGVESTAIIKSYGPNKKYRKALNRFPFLYSMMFMLTGLTSLFDRELINQYYDIKIDGADYSGRYATIAIANAPCYGGNKCPAPAAVPDDGLLDINLVPGRHTLKFISLFLKYLHGSMPDKYIIRRRASRISIRSGKPLLIQLDGEMMIDTNLTLELIPGALKLVVPKGLRYQRRKEFAGS